MKKLLATIALIGAAAFPLKAQPIFDVNAFMTSVSNAPSRAVTNGLIDCRKQKTVGVQITTAFTNGGTIPAGCARRWAVPRRRALNFYG